MPSARFALPTGRAFILLICCTICVLSNSTSSFQSQSICPAVPADWSALDTPVSGVTRPNACVVECALLSNCTAVHYNRTASACWPAASWQWQDRWRESPTLSPDCLSFMKLPSLDQQLPASLLPSLALWYSFRYSLNNLAGNGSVQQIATGLRLGAIRNASGLVLNASSESHANLTVPGGFESLFPGGRFSVYMKVYRRPRGQEVSYLQSSETSKSVTIMAEGADGKFTVGCRIYAQQKQATLQPVLQTPLTPGTVSVGFSYDGSAFRVFNNATMYATANAGNIPATSSGIEIRIGGKVGDSSATLDGRVLCFGLAVRALNVSEFQALENACN